MDDLQKQTLTEHPVEATKPGTADAELVEAIRAEHELTFFAAVRLYPKAMAWSAFVSTGVIMLAFDPQLLGNLYSMPQFGKDFGYEYKGEVGCTCLLTGAPY